MHRPAAVLLLTLLFAVSIHAATHAELFAAGREAMKKGDPVKAAELFEQAVKASPNNSEYHFWLGNAYGNQAARASILKQAGLAKKTKVAFERAVQLDPDNLDARNGLVEYYVIAPGFMGGSDEKALAQAAEIAKRDAARGRRTYARIYIGQKKPELAQKLYVDAVRQSPNSAEAHYDLGNFYAYQKDYKNAQHEFEYVLTRIDDDYMPAHFRLGQLAVTAGSNYAKGEESLKKYLTYTPKDTEPPTHRAWYWLGGIYEKTGRKAEARQAYQTSLKLAPGAKDVTEALKRVP
ncbi:MAG TPA: tetratricopeptide repeat protein [Thermoanaerobaculia bacterium]